MLYVYIICNFLLWAFWVVIDTCATFAEVQKRRGKDFWAEFELYAADVLTGLVVDVTLVSMLAPYAQIGIQFWWLSRAPSTCYCFFAQQGILYSAVGFGCGIIGQGIANMIMTAKRNIKNPKIPLGYKSRSMGLP